MRIEPKWVFWGSVVFMFAGIGLAVASNQILARWPLDTWRVDLDDLLTSVGMFGLGAAAWRRANDAHKKVERNGYVEHELEKQEENDYQELRDRIMRLEGDE